MHHKLNHVINVYRGSKRWLTWKEHHHWSEFILMSFTNCQSQHLKERPVTHCTLINSKWWRTCLTSKVFYLQHLWSLMILTPAEHRHNQGICCNKHAKISFITSTQTILFIQGMQHTTYRKDRSGRIQNKRNI